MVDDDPTLLLVIVVGSIVVVGDRNDANVISYSVMISGGVGAKK